MPGEDGSEGVEGRLRISVDEVQSGDRGMRLARLAVLARELGQRCPCPRSVAQSQLRMHQEMTGLESEGVRCDKLRLALLGGVQCSERLVEPALADMLHPPCEVHEKRGGGVEVCPQRLLGPIEPVLRLLKPALRCGGGAHRRQRDAGDRLGLPAMRLGNGDRLQASPRSRTNERRPPARAR